MDGDYQFFLVVWLNGVVFGLLAALLANRVSARRTRIPKGRPIPQDVPDTGGESMMSAPSAGIVYPKPQIAEEAHFPLPTANDLPPIVGDGIEWAWQVAPHRRGDVVVVSGKELGKGAIPTFVLGDIHGDATSLRRILGYVWGVHPRSRVVFLGDLVDRADGPEMLECARLFVWAIRRHPGRFLWIRGNHDYLARNADTGRFCTSVEPHEFCDYLNGHPMLTEEGAALGEIMAGLPVGAVLGNVWLSHGGVLQDDEAGLRSFAGFSGMTDEMKRDLVWTRMRDVPTKLAFRGSAGAEAGLRQAEAFVRRVQETDGAEIAHLVCAHQHESRDGFGYLPFDTCFMHGLTCQCIASFETKDACPAILRLNGTETPLPIVLPVESDVPVRISYG